MTERRILVVDDDPELRGLLRAALGRSLPNAHIREAHTVPMALAVLDAETFDLIVTDLDLGSQSGFDLVRHVKATAAVPVIVFTGHDSNETAAALIEAGADRVVPKSADGLSRLIPIVFALLAGS